MSRIGILTFHSANNFGALLQAVSLQKTIIEHGGTECELINYEPEFIYKDYSISPFKSKHPKVIIKSILRIPDKIKRNSKFQSFREENTIRSGQCQSEDSFEKTYVKVFYNQCALRPSCYECPYATTERKTDMTIGDFWHIEETIPDFYDEKGNSIFLIHTDRGEQLFETVKVKLEYRLSDTKQCWQANLEAPTKRSEQRDEFWNDYQRKGVDFVMKKYGTTPLKTKIKNKIVKLISIGGGKP